MAEKSKAVAVIDTKKKLGSLETAYALFQQKKGAIASVAAKQLDPERMLRVALSSIRKVPKLLECSGESMMAALMQAAQWGLEPDGRNAHLIPFGREVQLIPDYKGLIALARRSGEISTIYAEVACEDDKFDYQLGTDPLIVHKPTDGDRGEATHYYAVCKFKDGGTQFVVMSKNQAMAHGKKYSKSFDRKDSPWKTEPDAMGKKTCIRQLTKYLPLTPELQDAVEHSYKEDSSKIIEAEPFEYLPPEQTASDAKVGETPVRTPKKIEAEADPAPEADEVGVEPDNDDGGMFS